MFKRKFQIINQRAPITAVHQAQGTTLIELMISLTLSLMLLALLSTIYLAIESQDEMQAALNAVHDNSRFVLQRLTAELQAAGFIGCPRLTADFPLANTTAYPFGSNNSLELYQDSAGSTVITVRHRGPKTSLLQAPTIQPSVLELSRELKIAPFDLLLISDCRHAELFQVARITVHERWQSVILIKPLRYRYSENAEIGQFEINRYSVEKTGRRDETGQAVSALYRRDWAGHKTEVVEGIQRLKVAAFQPEKETKRLGVSIELEVRQKKLTKREYGFVSLLN